MILMRFFANAVRRRRRADRKLSFPGIGAEAEVRSPSANAAFIAVEAELDIEAILRETSPELRHILLMRYGVRSQWDEIAQEMSKSKEAIRKSCERELKRIRKKLKIRERAE
jgi:DNA-directed RNA polymerase specialized sigma24 family protein